MNIKKRSLIFLLCGAVIVSLVILAFVYQKMERAPVEYVKRHEENWIALLTNNREALPYLEQLYSMDDELTIHYRKGELTINESAINMFSVNELEKLENWFATFQWETIRLRKQTNAEEKVLEVISSQIIVGGFFRKHYGAAFLVYSPNDNSHSGEEIFPGWYYEVLFNV